MNRSQMKQAINNYKKKLKPGETLAMKEEVSNKKDKSKNQIKPVTNVKRV